MEMTGFSDTQLMVREAISQVCSQFPYTVHTGPIRALPIRVVDRCDTNRSETYSLRFAFIAAQEDARDKEDLPHSNTAGSWFRGWIWNGIEGQRAPQIQHAHPRRGRDPGFTWCCWSTWVLQNTVIKHTDPLILHEDLSSLSMS